MFYRWVQPTANSTKNDQLCCNCIQGRAVTQILARPQRQTTPKEDSRKVIRAVLRGNAPSVAVLTSRPGCREIPVPNRSPSQSPADPVSIDLSKVKLTRNGQTTRWQIGGDYSLHRGQSATLRPDGASRIPVVLPYRLVASTVRLINGSHNRTNESLCAVTRLSGVVVNLDTSGNFLASIASVVARIH